MKLARGGPLVAWLLGYFAGLRFPTLLVITATLFVADLLIPDFIPLADELLLGLLTLLLAAWRKPRTASPTELEPRNPSG